MTNLKTTRAVRGSSGGGCLTYQTSKHSKCKKFCLPKQSPVWYISILTLWSAFTITSLAVHIVRESSWDWFYKLNFLLLWWQAPIPFHVLSAPIRYDTHHMWMMLFVLYILGHLHYLVSSSNMTRAHLMSTYISSKRHWLMGAWLLRTVVAMW